MLKLNWKNNSVIFQQLVPACFIAKFHSFIHSSLSTLSWSGLQWKNTGHRARPWIGLSRKSNFVFCSSIPRRDTSALVRHVNKVTQLLNISAPLLLSSLSPSPPHPPFLFPKCFALNRQPPVPRQVRERAALGIKPFYSSFWPGLGCIFTGFIHHHRTTALVFLFPC